MRLWWPIKIFSVLLLALLVLSACSETSLVNTKSQFEAENKPVSYSVLVKFKDASSLQDGRAEQRLRASGLVRSKGLGLVPGLTQSSLEADRDLQQTLRDLRQQPNIEYAEPDYLVSALAIPNDPRFNEQYGLENTGQQGGTGNADINAPEAWDLQTGNDVVIAVIDSGVDYNHPDLRDNIWVNVNEIPDNGIDDDANGYIDDVNGWDFNSNTNNPMDDMDHGTHVAGTIAAVGDNRIGITGVNWKAKIMPLKFMNENGVGSVSKAIEALEYAVANGARISNNSWGGGAFSQAMYDALLAANSAGHIFITGAGNDKANIDLTPHYPSSYDLNNVISVVATDPLDQLATFSNYGLRTTDLAAPGVAILSTIRNRGYQTYSGSSIAAPLVSGVAGLVLSQNENLTVSDLRARLLGSIDKLASLSGKVATGGRINAFKAVSSFSLASTVTPEVSLALSPPNLKIPINTAQTFTGSGGLPPYRWSVSNANVGVIDATTGVFIAMAIGTAQVTMTDSNGGSAATQVTVKTLVISPYSDQSLNINEQFQGRVTGGQAPYQWRLTDSSIATLATNGARTTSVTINTDRVGRTRLEVTDANQAVDFIDIQVTDQPIGLLAVTPTQATLIVNETIQLTATGGGPSYTWMSSSASIAMVDPVSGIVTAMSVGTAMISVSSNGVTDPSTATITVVAAQTPTPIPTPTPTPGQISVTSPASSMVAGETLQFTATGGTAPYGWTVSNNLIATINENGLLSVPADVTFISQFTVSATDANGATGTSGTISVNPPAGTPPTPPTAPVPPIPTPAPVPAPGTPAPTPAPAPGGMGMGGGGMGGGGMGGGGMGGGGMGM